MRQWWQSEKARRRSLAALTLLVTLTACADADQQSPATEETTRANGESATVGARDTAAPSRNTATRRVVIMGTSLTAGLGLDPDDAYPALLQRKVDSAGFNLQISNAGLSGETSAGALRRIGWVLDQPAAAVVLEVGANDGLRGVNPDSTYANLVAIIHEVKRLRPEAVVLLVQMEAPTNLGADYTAQFHNAYVRAANDTGVKLLPFLLDGVAGVARFNQGDGIHPNERGAQLVADNLWRALLPILHVISG